jgi:hypothetical protein
MNNEQTNHLQTMLETLIYIVHEINLEQVKLTTTINQLIKRINQNELYLNQLNINIETLYEQYHVRKEKYFQFEKKFLFLFQIKQQSEFDIDQPTSMDDHCQQPIDMSTTGNNYNPTKTTSKSTANKV